MFGVMCKEVIEVWPYLFNWPGVRNPTDLFLLLWGALVGRSNAASLLSAVTLIRHNHGKSHWFTTILSLWFHLHSGMTQKMAAGANRSSMFWGFGVLFHSLPRRDPYVTCWVYHLSPRTGFFLCAKLHYKVYCVYSFNVAYFFQAMLCFRRAAQHEEYMPCNRRETRRPFK